MARTLKLTWDKAGSRWKKIYKGRVLYFPFGAGKSDSLGYKRALEEFTRRRAEIDSRTEAQKPPRDAYEEAIGLRRNMLDWIGLEAERLDTDPDLKAWRERLLAEVGRLEADFARPSPPELNKPGGLRVDPLTAERPGVVLRWLDRLGSIGSHKRWAQDDIPAHTVATAVDEYLAKSEDEGGVGPDSPDILSADQRTAPALPGLLRRDGRLEARREDPGEVPRPSPGAGRGWHVAARFEQG